MTQILAALIALACALPAAASSLFLDDTDSASLGIGTLLDQVIVTDSAHLDVIEGSIGEITLLDFATADFLGGAGLGVVEVYDDSEARIHGAAADFTVDGNPAPAVILAALCPACTLAGALGHPSHEALSIPLLKVAQHGKVTFVPEPETLGLVGLGLLGLVAAARRARA